MGQTSYYVSLNIGLAKNEFARFIAFTLIDEFEKATPSVYNFFYELLEDGIFTDRRIFAGNYFNLTILTAKCDSAFAATYFLPFLPFLPDCETEAVNVAAKTSIPVLERSSIILLHTHVCLLFR